MGRVLFRKLAQPVVLVLALFGAKNLLWFPQPCISTDDDRFQPGGKVIGSFSSAQSFIRTIANSSTAQETMKHIGSAIRPQNGVSSSLSLISPEGMKQVGSSLARSFPTRSILWCTGGDSLTKGLLYVKVPKSASTTTASVVHRISRRNGDCNFHNGHTLGTKYSNREVNASFLLGSVRDPASRAISRIFFWQVSQGGMKPTDVNIIHALNHTNWQYGAISKGNGGFQLNYMSTYTIPEWSAWQLDSPTEVIDPAQVDANVKKLLESYDFMVVVERIDESLVVLAILLGVSIGDVLMLNSKAQGVYEWHSKREECFKIQKSHVSDRVREYVSSDRWYAQNYGDYVLHAAANASLDRTIDALGRSKVERQVEKYRQLKSKLQDKCASSAIFPCSLDGKDQRAKSEDNCYLRDQGCGYKCIDEFLEMELK